MPLKNWEETIEAGRKICKLTVIERAGEGRFGAPKWLCRCECGNVLIADETSLRNHNIRSCGCCDAKEDLTGQKFGMMTVLGRAVNDPAGKARCLCRCDCGKEKVMRIEHLRNNPMPNCGCYSHEQWVKKSTKHGTEGTPLYTIWNGMKNRCYNPKQEAYERYGAKGIMVCDRWRDDPRKFIEDMGPTYQPGLQIDRIDYNGPYSPENCRWVTQKENARNKSNNHIVDTIYGKVTLAEAAERSGLLESTICDRERKDVPAEFLTLKTKFHVFPQMAVLNEEPAWLDEKSEKKLLRLIGEAEDQIKELKETAA
ncbi:MAG: hypothetical protein IJ206_04235 [Oscillospiraceae bacterium]|nr:hypothetical protein [Oscillospiraceae bacterium]